MPRSLTREEEERFLRWSGERERLFLALRNAPSSVKVKAYKQLETRILRETHTAFEKQEMRRRIAEDLLTATSEGPWRGFSPYLRRMERLGYSSLFSRLMVCVLAARASRNSPAGVRKVAALIADIERRARGRKFPPDFQAELNASLARARSFAGLDTGSDPMEAPPRWKRMKSP